jgi:hypothetical protein
MGALSALEKTTMVIPLASERGKEAQLVLVKTTMVIPLALVRTAMEILSVSDKIMMGILSVSITAMNPILEILKVIRAKPILHLAAANRPVANLKIRGLLKVSKVTQTKKIPEVAAQTAAIQATGRMNKVLRAAAAAVDLAGIKAITLR